MRAPLFILLALLVARWNCRAAECLRIGVASGGVSTAAVERIADRIFVVAGSCAELLIMPSNRITAQQRNLSTVEVRSYDQMAEMARSGRLQGFITAGEVLALLRPRYDFLGDYASRTVADIPLYLVLDRRNADRLPALDQAIQTLRGRGEIERELRAEDK